jgi:predicted nucleic acid-binding protein
MNFFDSNVLIAGAYEDHDRFKEARAVLDAVRERGGGLTSAHALAETFAILTTLPKPNRFSPDEASRYVCDAALFLKVVALEARSMLRLLAELARSSVAGGRVYDAVHARTAARAGATTIITWNERHFRGLEPRLKVAAPAAALAAL